jgi:hypothetical protein
MDYLPLHSWTQSELQYIYDSVTDIEGGPSTPGDQRIIVESADAAGAGTPVTEQELRALMTKTISRLATAATTAAVLATLAVSSPAQAATPTSTPVTRIALAASSSQHFHLEYGASVADGDISFSNRSVTISGSVKAVSGSRTVRFVGYNGNGSCYFSTTRTASAGTTIPLRFVQSCNVAGGFSEVDVYFPV